MKRLNNILLFRVFVVFSFFVFLRVIYFLKYDVNSYKYTDDTIIYGIVIRVRVEEDITTIEFKGKEKVLVKYYGVVDGIKCGDKLKISGTIAVPSGNTNFYLFNYRNYLKSKRIYHTFTASSIEKIGDNKNVISGMYNFLKEYIDTFKCRDYLYTFVLGDNSVMDDSILESYRTNGISHLFSVSGLHISLLSMCLIKFLRLFIKAKRVCYFVVILILIVYLFFTNFSPSICRAFLMFLFLSIKKFTSIKIKTIYIIVFVLDLMLLYNPYYIYNVGFVFSFLVSIGLIAFCNNEKKYILSILKSSIIAFVISLPVVINNFSVVNFLSFIFNLFFIPFVSFVILPLSYLCLFLKPLDNFLYLLIQYFEFVSLFFNRLGLIFSFKYISIYFFIFYYALIITVLYFFKRRYYKPLFLLLVVLIIHYNINYFNSNLVISFLDVGQGDCILIELPHNRGNVLIDVGGKPFSKFDISDNIIIPYLKKRGIRKIDYLIFTHGDYDHIGSGISFINSFKVDNVLFNSDSYNNMESKIIDLLNKKNITYYKDMSELIIGLNKFYFLNSKLFDNENDNSSVMYFKYDDVKLLFMGDAGINRENEILDKYNLSNIDILKVGHHGSGGSSGENFIKEIIPKYSIISVGANNGYGHPNKGVLDNLAGSNIYRTDIDGGVIVKIKNGSVDIDTCVKNVNK